MIKVKYDDSLLKEEDVVLLSKALKRIVIEATHINEVFVYADSPKIKIDVAPIEVFIEMSTSKVLDKQELFNKIKEGVVAWKKESKFAHPITITLTPVDWQFEVGL